MDLDRTPDGHWHFRLGPVEKWIASLVVLLTGSLLVWIFNTVTSTQATQGQTLSEIKTQQAVTNSKLDQLTTSMANVPQLTSDVATLKVQTQRNSDDIHELQQVRKLR
jgi:hypothetical protein